MNRLVRPLAVAAVFAAVTLTGCDEKAAPSAPAPSGAGSAAVAAAPSGGGSEVSAEALAEAHKIFATRCALCHGTKGAGDGAGAAALNPRPPNFGDGTWQQSVTDAHIETIVARGGAAVGKSPLMPPNPDLAGKPVVAGLRQVVREMAAGAN